jgi:hypothetical protein
MLRLEKTPEFMEAERSDCLHNTNLREVMKELEPLRFIFRGQATPGWILKTARECVAMEPVGHLGFGGPTVLAYQLCRKARQWYQEHADYPTINAPPDWLRLVSYFYQIKVEKRGTGHVCN